MIPEDNLTDVEKRMLAAFQAGDTDVDVAGAEIRGDFLRGLFLSGYDEKADYRGTRIVGAIISDMLNMEFCEVKFPVRFHDCSFVQRIKLQQLTCPELDFRGCTLKKGFDAPGAKVDGSMSLNDGFKSVGEVTLFRTEIGGQLVCAGGDFRNEKGDALNARSIKVADDVLLHRGFKAVGEVSLLGADIRGQLDCANGNFQNEGGYTLNAQNIKVTDTAFLCNGFKSVGAVSLVGAEIGGQLVCTRGSFQNEEGDALNAQDIKAAAAVFLDEEFEAVGAVNLVGANIGGQLNCTGGSFRNGEEIALNARNIKVANEALIHNFSAIGRVLFVSANVGGNLVFSNCKITHLSLTGANVLGEFRDDADVYKNEKGRDITLNIDGFRYQRLSVANERVKDRLQWVGSMSKDDKFRPQPYEQLMKVYREMGHINWARRVGFELEKKRHKQLRLNRDHKRFLLFGWAWWMWYWALRGTIGYGYKPFRIITRWLLPAIVGGSLFLGIPCTTGENPLALFAGVANPQKECQISMLPSDAEVLLSENWRNHKDIPPGYTRFVPFFYAVEVALPVLPLGQTETWHPENPLIKFIQQAITIIEVLALTILASYGVGVLGPRWKNE